MNTRKAPPPPPHIKDGHPRGLKRKEDDQKKKDDYIEKNRRMENDVMMSGRPPSPRMVIENENGDSPPPPPGLGCPYEDGGGGVLPERAGSSPPTCMDGWMADVSQPRALVSMVEGVSDDCVRKMTFGKKTADGITVNGVKLMVLQKMKNSTKMKTTQNVKKTPQRRMKKTVTPTPSNNKILKYLVKKKAENTSLNSTCEKKTPLVEDNSDNTPGVSDNNTPAVYNDNDDRQKNNTLKNDNQDKKTTFVVKKTVRVKESVKMFQELATGKECVLGSGRCSTHNVKLLRSVCQKRMSVISDDGTVTWTMGEGVVLACPYKQAGSTDTATRSAPLKSEGANGNKRFCLNERMDQSLTEPARNFGREETPLDKIRTDCGPLDKQTNR